MQGVLNKTVLCVRKERISSDGSSRTVHECGTMLGMKIAERLPENILLVTNMRKAAKAEDLTESFKVFGALKEVVVALNGPGFGEWR